MWNFTIIHTLLSPQDMSRVRLKIFGNSTRRARWDARLGHFGAAAILTPLSSVQPDGGKVSKLRALITRVYPTLYVEKFDDGSTGKFPVHYLVLRYFEKIMICLPCKKIETLK